MVVFAAVTVAARTASLASRSRLAASLYLSTSTRSSGVPVVDLSQPPEVVGQSIHNACTDVGFFSVVNHGVSPDLCRSVLSEARKLFDLPAEEKDKISIRNSDSFRGYQKVGENVTGGSPDAHEALDLFSESDRARRPGDDDDEEGDGSRRRLTNYGKNQWPDESIQPKIRPVMDQYVKEMASVGSKLMRGCALGLGLENPHYFDEFFDDPFWILRLIRYPAPQASILNGPPAEEDEMGCGEHTDYGIFTLILSEDVPDTLQIRTKCGGWMSVDPLPGAFTCNVGDMLSRWTNGLYRSTPHRVLRPMKGGKGRVSCPFFFEPSYDAVIKPIDDLVRRSGMPSSFDAIRYGDHLLAKTSSNFIFN